MQVTCMIQIKIKDTLQSDVYLNGFRFYFIVLRVRLSHVWPIVNLYFSQTWFLLSYLILSYLTKT